MKKIFLLFIILSVIAKNPALLAQSRNRIDSLFSVINTASQTIVKVNALNALVYEFRNNNPDTAIYFAKQAQVLAIKLNYMQGVADSYLWRSWAIMSLGNYDEALRTASYSLNMYTTILTTENGIDTFKILKQKAKAYNNIGLIYSNKGNNTEALINYFASLKIKNEINDQQGIAQTHNNIGSICELQGNYPEALKNYFIALKLGEKFGNKQDVSYYYNNIGIIYFDMGNYSEALKNHLAALKIRKAFNDKKGISASYNNIGTVYFKQKNSLEALNYFTSALKIQEEIEDKRGVAQSFNNIGNFYLEEKNYAEALKSYLASSKINFETGDKEGLALTYNNIGNLYLKLY